MGEGSKAKRQKLSQDTVESDDEEQASSVSDNLQEKEKEVMDGLVKKNEEGESFVELSAKRRITVRKWKGSTLIDIREYWGDDGDVKPGKKGISLSVEQWQKLLKAAPEINELLGSK